VTPREAATYPEARHEAQGRVELVRDTSPARWLEERLWSWPNDGVHVGSIVPEGFQAYARILHPAEKLDAGAPELVRWSTVAHWNHKTIHPEMQFDRIANLPGPWGIPDWGSRPLEGTVPFDEAQRLASRLRRFTLAPDRCWFAVWDGFGYMDPDRYGAIPRLTLPNRNYILYQGPVDAVNSFYWDYYWQGSLQTSIWQSPNLWWPDDRAWCVGTDIDLVDTYVAGSEAAADAIVSDPGFEAFRTGPTARVDINGDTINK
jgi:hypothetical protein